MKTITLLAALLLTFAPAISPDVRAAYTFGPEIDALLDTLDTALGHSEEYVGRKEARLSALRAALARANEPEQRYYIVRDLYNENCAYDSDSALCYAGRQLELATEVGRERWIDEANMNRCYLYSATGRLDEAQRCIDAVNPTRLSESQFMVYHENLLFLWTHRNQYLDENPPGAPYTHDVDELLESLCRTLPATAPQYCWFIGWRSLVSEEKAAQAIPMIERQMQGRRYDTRDDAKDAWILSRLYDKVGRTDESVRYLILSAIADVRACNKEIASLEELSSIMYDVGEYGRANDYITYCIQCANSYKSRVRVGRLADIQYRITRGYSHQNYLQARQIRRYAVVLVAISLVLTVALIFIYMQMRRIKKSRRELHAANDELQSRVAELQEVRSRLKEANDRLSESYSTARKDVRELSETNEAKERYIGHIFAICSNYISKLDDLRKRIYRMILAGRFDEVRELTKSPELSQSELKELYATFDKIFLDIYPDFVRDFNTLLRPDMQITTRRGELLTTELRIYALVRLGINDSVKIAKFLHCSVQTVYNTRLRTRNKAVMPKEEFTAAVRRLGTPNL